MVVGRPRLENGEIRVPVKVSISHSNFVNARAAKINLSAICESAISRKLNGQIFLPEIKVAFVKAVNEIEKELDEHSLLSASNRLKFGKLKRLVQEIDGDAYVSAEKLQRIKDMQEDSEPNNGTGEKTAPKPGVEQA